jgi:hypothetical protein
MIILVGSHGTGKTTLLKEYKKKYGMNIRDGVSRPVRKVTNQFGLNGYIEQKLINELTYFYFDYNKDIPNLGMTRSVFDNIIYSEVFGWNDLRDESIERFKSLDLSGVKFVYIPIMFDIEDDGVRYTDKELQLKVDKAMRYYLDYFNIKYYTIKSNVLEERIEQLHEIVNNQESTN